MSTDIKTEPGTEENLQLERDPHPFDEVPQAPPPSIPSSLTAFVALQPLARLVDTAPGLPWNLRKNIPTSVENLQRNTS